STPETVIKPVAPCPATIATEPAVALLPFALLLMTPVFTLPATDVIITEPLLAVPLLNAAVDIDPVVIEPIDASESVPTVLVALF
ncbi:hypothetical protein ABTH20_20595, partial [Acinetobacter baumannii]